MDRCETEDGVVFTREGERTRALAGAANYLFAIPEPLAARQAYGRALAAATAHFRSRWEEAARAVQVPSGAFDRFVQHAALDAMYTCDLLVTVGPMDFTGPATRRILSDHAAACLGRPNEEALAFCARVLGLTCAALEGQLEGDRQMQARR